MQHLQEACDWVTFKKLEIHTRYPAGTITVETQKKILFLHPLDHQKMNIQTPEKYSIMNKSTTFAHSRYPFVNLLNFASFLRNSQQLSILNKSKQTNRKIRCLITVNKYLRKLPWVDCAFVELSQKKKEFHIRMYFILNLTCFFLNLDSSAYLGNNI